MAIELERVHFTPLDKQPSIFAESLYPAHPKSVDIKNLPANLSQQEILTNIAYRNNIDVAGLDIEKIQEKLSQNNIFVNKNDLSKYNLYPPKPKPLPGVTSSVTPDSPSVTSDSSSGAAVSSSGAAVSSSVASGVGFFGSSLPGSSSEGACGQGDISLKYGQGNVVLEIPLKTIIANCFDETTKQCLANCPAFSQSSGASFTASAVTGTSLASSGEMSPQDAAALKAAQDAKVAADAKVAELQSQLNDLKAKPSTTGDNSALEAQIASLQAKIAALEAAKTKAEKDSAAALKSKDEAAAAAAAAALKSKTEADIAAAALKTKTDAAAAADKAKIDSLTAQISVLESQLEEQKKLLATAEAEIASLNSAGAASPADTAALKKAQDVLEAAKARIAQLEAEINNLKAQLAAALALASKKPTPADDTTAIEEQKIRAKEAADKTQQISVDVAKIIESIKTKQSSFDSSDISKTLAKFMELQQSLNESLDKVKTISSKISTLSTDANSASSSAQSATTLISVTSLADTAVSRFNEASALMREAVEIQEYVDSVLKAITDADVDALSKLIHVEPIVKVGPDGKPVSDATDVAGKAAFFEAQLAPDKKAEYQNYTKKYGMYKSKKSEYEEKVKDFENLSKSSDTPPSAASSGGS
jgi:hypothetical protein